MISRRTTTKAPAVRAARVSRFVDAAEPDAYEVAAAWYRQNGWTPIEQDYAIVAAGAYVEVYLWAIPPSKRGGTA